MNIYVPAERALCVAENCTANQHNVYTLRGAQVRDALMWSKYIDQSLELYAAQCDVLFASHHWPRWGQADLSTYLASQRDAYRYVHDQTLRMANHGLTMNEIAEELELPAGLGDEFFNRGYYGTLSHNAKAVYQRYLGWFDGNPAHLNPHPPVEAATRYVEFMGGADAVWNGPARPSPRATTDGWSRSSTTSSSLSRRMKRPGSCRPTRSNSSDTRASRGRGATSISVARWNCDRTGRS